MRVPRKWPYRGRYSCYRYLLCLSGSDAIKAHCSISAIRLRPTGARARVPT
jgi:hypothetical protein